MDDIALSGEQGRRGSRKGYCMLLGIPTLNVFVNNEAADIHAVLNQNLKDTSTVGSAFYLTLTLRLFTIYPFFQPKAKLQKYTLKPQFIFSNFFTGSTITA